MKLHLNDKEFRQWQAAVALQYGIESVPVKEEQLEESFELLSAANVGARIPGVSGAKGRRAK